MFRLKLLSLWVTSERASEVPFMRTSHQDMTPYTHYKPDLLQNSVLVHFIISAQLVGIRQTCYTYFREKIQAIAILGTNRFGDKNHSTPTWIAFFSALPETTVDSL